MKKHFVTFLSPGTFISEETTREIESWDVAAAKAIAKEILERHGAVPYGFFFTTRSRAADDFDSKESARSGTYFLGGIVETVSEIAARGDPNDHILLLNMKGNNWDKVITNNNSWQHTTLFKDGDVLLSWP